MAIRVRDLNQLNEASFDHLLANTNGQITFLQPGSICRALVETVNRNIEGLYNALEVNMAAAYLSKASGPYLDLIGQMFGIQRREATYAGVNALDRAIRFFVRTGTLIDVLPDGANLNRGIIPRGTTVTNADGSIIYTVEEDTYFPRTATEIYVSARASSIGISHNIGAFALSQHSLGNSAIEVSNPISITTARSRESDDEYRARISTVLRANEGGNETAIRLAALSAPGVADVKLIPHLFGAGTFDVLLVPTGNRLSLETVAIVNRNIQTATSFGMFFRVREPNYVRLSLVVSLTYKQGVLSGEESLVRQNVERAILDYFGRLRMGSEMVVTEMGAAIRQADERVYDYRLESMCLNGFVQLPHNYRLRPDELFLPDESLEDPIRVL